MRKAKKQSSICLPASDLIQQTNKHLTQPKKLESGYSVINKFRKDRKVIYEVSDTQKTLVIFGYKELLKFLESNK